MDEIAEVQRISIEEAKQNLDADKSIVLLDVRTKMEYAEGHIEGAINVPVNELEYQIEDVIPDKEQTIYLYCRSGVRTIMAGDTLLNLGYTSVYDMGGIIYWPYEIVK